MKIHLTSLGCAKNQVDSELMLGMFLERGHLPCDVPQEADAIIVNTCAFIEPAVEEAIDTILELAGLKNDQCRLIVCGCLPERYRNELADSLPEVDFFFGTGAYDRVADALEAELSRLDRCCLPPPENIRLAQAFAGRMWSREGFAYLKIAEGCDRRCTYCIIPRLRGRQRSRTVADVVSEAIALAETGARELVLISQETSAYGRDLEPQADLAGLLAVLSERLPDIWIRSLYLHPDSVTPGLIRIIAERDNICPYFDIPVQHAADRMLKRMGRRHTGDDLHRLFSDIRNKVPEAALRTTVMVGFPGETEADMDRLLRFVEEIRFDHLGVFVYSDHVDLASHDLAGHVARDKAEARRHRLMIAQADISRALNSRRLGEKYRVLLEKQIHDRLFEGRAMFQAPEADGIIRVACEAEAACGDFVTVRVTEATEYDLSGKTE